MKSNILYAKFREMVLKGRTLGVVGAVSFRKEDFLGNALHGRSIRSA